MNNPALPLEDELRRIAAAGFGLVDLTLEPPGAWPSDGRRVAALLADLGLTAVGHTAYYLPIASPFPELREQALEALGRAFETFAEAGVRLVNVHPDPMNRMFPTAEVLARNAEAIAALAEEGRRRGIRIMVENLGRAFGTVDELRPLLDAADGVGFHLDIGHAHLAQRGAAGNRSAELLAAFGDRLAHVHAHDNFGADDLHLPLGTGTIRWPDVVGALKAAGWDGTATLEVFAAERAYLDLSRRLWLGWWDDGAEQPDGGAGR